MVWRKRERGREKGGGLIQLFKSCLAHVHKGIDVATSYADGAEDSHPCVQKLSCVIVNIITYACGTCRGPFNIQALLHGSRTRKCNLICG